MSLFAFLNGSDVGNRIRLNDMGLTSNADGSPGFGGIIFEDDGSLDIRGWMRVIVKEVDCTSAPVLFTGYIGPRTYGRGGEAAKRILAESWCDATIVDENAVLHIRVITGNDGKRPAETHNERIDWLVESSYLNGLVDDTSLVNTGNPRPFEEADYRGQHADDVLNDISAPIDRIFFMYPTQPDGGRGLFFDSIYAVTSTSTLTISNVLSDVSRDSLGNVIGTCFPPSQDLTLSRDPSEVIARVRYTYAHGTVVVTDYDTVDEFFTDNDLGLRGIQVENSRIGLKSSALEMGQHILNRHSTEADVISVTIQVPPSQVGLVHAGDRMGVRFSHLPGYETQQFLRVTSRTIQQAAGNNELYDVHLELSSHGRSGGGGGGAPPPGTFPQPPAEAAVVQTKTAYVDGTGAGIYTLTLDQTPGDGGVLIAWETSRGVDYNDPPTGWTLHPDGVISPGADYARMIYRATTPSDTTTLQVLATGEPGGWVTVWELAGVELAPNDASSDVVDTGTMPSSVDAGTLSPTSGSKAIAVMGIDAHSTDSPGQVNFVAAGSGFTEDGAPWSGAHPLHWSGHRVIDTTSGTYATTQGFSGFSANFGGWGGEALIFLASAASTEPPAPGQVVPWTVVSVLIEATTTVGVTPSAYANNSLQIKVDGVLISPASYTETDPTCGLFTLLWVLDGDEVVTVTYQGR